jgi:hypothetical protein
MVFHAALKVRHTFFHAGHGIPLFPQSHLAPIPASSLQHDACRKKGEGIAQTKQCPAHILRCRFRGSIDISAWDDDAIVRGKIQGVSPERLEP